MFSQWTKKAVWITIGLASLGAGASLAITACRPQPYANTAAASDTTAMTVVSGTVTYRQRMALPAGAVVRVSVQDVSLQDAPARVVGEQVITTKGEQVPLKYAIPIPSSHIDPRARYSVSARIELEGKLRFISTTNNAVITNGNPLTFDIVVDQVP